MNKRRFFLARLGRVLWLKAAVFCLVAEQDPEFGLAVLAEIASKELSPAISSAQSRATERP